LFRNNLMSCLGHLGFTLSRGNPDVWLRPAQKSNGEEYYEYLFVYTDNILEIGVAPKDILMKLNMYFKLKPDSIYPCDDSLGTNIKKKVPQNGASAWGQSSSYYVSNAVKSLEEWMVKEGRKLPKKAPNPMSSTYKHEVDVSPELSPDMANYYQPQVGVLMWIIKIVDWT
jgi:hypothetical protein